MPNFVIGQPKGLLEPGNLDLDSRPVIKNADGSHSSEYSTSFGDSKGREILVPTIVHGRFLTPNGKKPLKGSEAEKKMFWAAQEHYNKTKEHLGIFSSSDAADNYANIVHNRPQPKKASMNNEFSPILALMKEVAAPLTRDEYLRFNNLGKKSKVTPEEEAELPSRFQYPVVTHEELPEVKPAASGTKGKTSKTPIKHFNGKVFQGTTEGAPVNFRGPVLPNPKGVKPMLDTEQPQASAKAEGGMNTLPYYQGDYAMDISNAPVAPEDVTPEPTVPMRASRTPVIREQ